MRRVILLMLLALVLSKYGIAAAQTDTPTPTTGPWAFATVDFGHIPSPTPRPTSTSLSIEVTVDLPTDYIYDSLATVEGHLREAPENIAPAGWLPNQTGYQLFSYTKWMLSGQVGEELLGPFGPFVGRLEAILVIQIVMAAIYFIIFIARFVVRFVQWIITNILKFIPFFG